MILYQFFGIIHPERAQVSMTVPMTAINGNGKTDKILISVINNQVYVKIETEVVVDNIYTARNFVLEIVQDLLAVISLVKGYAHTVEITRIVCDQQKIDFVFGIEIPVLEERGKDKDLMVEVLKITRLISADPSLGAYVRLCLTDLNQSMKRATDTAFHCFRALESLRNYCGAKYNIQDEKEQWKKLGGLTGFGPDKTEFIRTKAFPTRHGQLAIISDEERKQVFVDTWDVVEKFISAEGK